MRNHLSGCWWVQINSFASNVVNLPTSLSLSEVWPSAQVSLIQSNALSGSVDADMTASLVRILQFLWDSAWGKAGILIVAASLTLLLLSLVWSLGMPKNGSHSTHKFAVTVIKARPYCHRHHRHLHPQAHLPVVVGTLGRASYHLCPFYCDFFCHRLSARPHQAHHHMVGRHHYPSLIQQGW